jgi:hypothetical protein
MKENEEIIRLIKATSELFPIKYIEKNQEFIFKVEGDSRTFTIKKEEISKKLQNLKKLKTIAQEENILYSDKSYECMVRFRSSEFEFFNSNLFQYTGETLTANDDLEKIRYEVSFPSYEYIISFIMRLSEGGYSGAKGIYKMFFLGKSLEHSGWSQRKSAGKWKNLDEDASEKDFFEYIRKNVINKTVKVYSETALKLDLLKKLKDAFLYNICFNRNLSITEVKSLQDTFVFGSAKGFRKRSDLAPPKRFYDSELINHYQIAVSSDNSAYEYLSFYHVIESFFEKIYNEDLIKRIQDALTKPDFSCTSESDIKKIIKITRDSVKQFKEENLIINEQQALMLTLKKYVKLDELRDDLNDYDPHSHLLDYYKNEEVVFSGGEKFDLNDLNQLDNIYDKLSSRIYKTRNSIVHSKESIKKIYNHFKHERILNKEIPLIRFIAEQVIYNSSKIIDIPR